MKSNERAQIRKRCGLTQIHLAKLTGISQARLSSWENQETKLSPKDLRAALTGYFSGDLDRLSTIRWRVAGTAFQHKFWTALPRIPPGTTMSYGALAARIDRPKAVRAVGHANGANPISVVVPCHRLIGADGSLVKYGGGLERKRWLLEHEGVVLKPAANGVA